MKPAELVALLQECYRDRLALVERHKAVAVHVSNYDANNTYQYVINREETHLEWLGDSLVDLGAPLPANPAGPSITLDRSKDAWKAAAADDARSGAVTPKSSSPAVANATARGRTVDIAMVRNDTAGQVDLPPDIARRRRSRNVRSARFWSQASADSYAAAAS